jgi:hypothetical protein
MTDTEIQLTAKAVGEAIKHLDNLYVLVIEREGKYLITIQKKHTYHETQSKSCTP